MQQVSKLNKHVPRPKGRGLAAGGRILVNQRVIKANDKNNENNPVLTVKTYKENTYAHEVEIDGPSKVVYSPDSPLSCGAKVWVETQSVVRITK